MGDKRAHRAEIKGDIGRKSVKFQSVFKRVEADDMTRARKRAIFARSPLASHDSARRLLASSCAFSFEHSRNLAEICCQKVTNNKNNGQKYERKLSLTLTHAIVDIRPMTSIPPLGGHPSRDGDVYRGGYPPAT